VTQAAAPSIDWNGLACEIKERACALGFDLAGIAAAEPSGYRDYFRAWLAEGQAGEMAYLQNRFDQRTDPATYMPGARSVICVALNYHVSLRPTDPDEADLKGRIARYALGDDYHEVIKSRLHELADWVRRTVPGCQTRAAVDTAPIMEKELAARAGIGWLGKNTCIIHPRIGSWIVLGEIVTDLPLPPDAPVADHCGSCTRCIDACPTAAITAPYQLDARRCISYLTIEHRGEIEAELKPRVGDWLFGCDICQEVCPFNRRSPDTADLALQPRFPAGSLDAGVILTWTPDTYREKLRHSAMKRVKLPILQRNAAMVTQNHREDSD
jgi:epoxyqueuosine reductase